MPSARWIISLSMAAVAACATTVSSAVASEVAARSQGPAVAQPPVTVQWQAPLRVKGVPAVTVQAGSRVSATGVTEVCGRVSESPSVVAVVLPGQVDPRAGLTVPFGKGRQAWRCQEPGKATKTEVVVSWAHRAITVEGDRSPEALVACPPSPQASALATGSHCGDGVKVAVLDGSTEGGSVVPAEIELIDGGWQTYIAFVVYEGGDEDDTEYPACRRAEKLLKRKDPKLFKRIVFDQEANGTGVYAETRADLRRALTLLGIPLRPRRVVLL